MRIGIIGTGGVARTLGRALAENGHDVALGSRDPQAALARDDVNRQTGTTLAGWAEENPGVSIVPIPEAAAHGDTVWNATSGTAGSAPVASAGAAAVEGKIVVDITNPTCARPTP